jgi:hypothetical protein
MREAGILAKATFYNMQLVMILRITQCFQLKKIKEYFMFNKFKESIRKPKDNLKKSLDSIGDAVSSENLDKIKDAYSEGVKYVGNKVDELSDNYIDSGLENLESYCSWCFEKHGVVLKEKSSLSRNIYVCSGCGNEVVKCRACNNKAKYSSNEEVSKEVNLWSNNFCAVHEGVIASFERLNWKLKSIAEYGSIVDRDDRNYKKIATTAAYTVGGAALIAPLALAAAPAIGGAIGTSVFGYTGAAASSSGLALLGGGATAAGGYGMAGGIAVLTATGTALGGRYGAVISNSYYGDIDEFKIVRAKPGISPAIVPPLSG